MENEFPAKSEIYLLLALKRMATANQAEAELTEDDFPALCEQLNESQRRNLRRRLTSYQKKSAAEKEIWRAETASAIGADENFIDRAIHRTHIDRALEKESPAIRKIIGAALAENSETFSNRNINSPPLEKSIRNAFAKQFVSLAQLTKPTAFDRLSGAQLARLIRRAGIHEVALACARIEAVESVAAFLRQFPAEDARTIAAQIGNLRENSAARMEFAEEKVRNAFETEPNPAAMLDWLGVWLVGILLCDGAAKRIAYTRQKLPLEFAPQLPEIIAERCRQTPSARQREIASEIERLAETITAEHAK